MKNTIVSSLTNSFRGVRTDVWQEREWFLTTLKSIDDAVIATDTKGCITFINPSALKMTEWSLTEVLGKKLSDVFVVYDAEKRRRVINPVPKVVRSNRTTRREENIFLISNSGNRFEIDYSISPIVDRLGRLLGTVVVFRDISQKKFVREGLGRMATIVNSSQDAIYSIDMKGRIRTWNKGAEKLFGYSEKEVLGQSLRKFTVPKESAKQYDESVARLANKIELPPFETTRKTKKGQIVEVLVSASPIYDTEGKVGSISVVTHDITARKKMEQDLFFANRRFELASEAVRGLIYDWDLKNNYVYRSVGLYRVTGFRPEEVPPKADWWVGRIHPDDQERLKWWTSLNFKTKGKYTVDYRFLHKNNTYVKIWDHGIVEKDATGVGIRIIGSAIDFTEREEQEQRKNEFISMASHELKTPLTSLKVFTQFLKNLLADNKEAGHFLGRMDEQVDKLTAIVNDLLDVSRIESGKLRLKKTNFSLEKLIAETVEMIQATTADHQIITKGRLGKSIYADKDRIGEVLINLLTNAIKYSPGTDKVEISILKHSTTATVKVKDYGIGIAKKNIPYVFDRFFRVYGIDHKNYPGLGMGLYISAEIIKRHHGKMWVKTKKGQGSAFYFSLPFHNEKPKE